jgi:broad specificity phosphatase PhoE
LNLYLVRHGETDFNREGRGLGRWDVALTELGNAQAAAIGDWFGDRRVDRVYSSPLSRSLEAARAIAAPHGIEVIVEPALIELDVGSAEGLHYAEMREQFGEFLREWAGPEGHLAAMPGGGESVSDVAARLAPFLDSIRQPGDEHIALVTHNFVVRVAVCLLLGLPASQFRSFSVDLASISEFRLGKESAVLHRFNETCHLIGLRP